MNMKAVHNLIEAHGPEGLFRTQEGVTYLKKALQALRFGARAGAATVRFPELRDKLPSHIRKDILNQAVKVSEFIGRCDVMLFLIEETDPERQPNRWKHFTGIFCSIYDETCNKEESLRKLCKLTLEEYKGNQYVDTSRVIDQDF